LKLSDNGDILCTFFDFICRVGVLEKPQRFGSCFCKQVAYATVNELHKILLNHEFSNFFIFHSIRDLSGKVFLLKQAVKQNLLRPCIYQMRSL
jgi:hypothetical protein